MYEKINKQVDSLSIYLPSNGKLDMSPKPARWYGNTGFNIVVFVLSFYVEITHYFGQWSIPRKNMHSQIILVKAKANFRVHVFLAEI